MENLETKQLDNPRVIAGLFREALFFKRPCTVACATQTMQGIVAAVEETNTIAKEIKREVKIELQKSQYKAVGMIVIRIFFPRFICEVTLDSYKQDNASLTFTIPDFAKLTNLRQDNRYEVKNSNLTATVLLNENTLHAEGILQILDMSENGIGGLLSVSAEFPLSPNTSVRGYVESGSTGIKLNGQLTQIQIYDENLDGIRRYKIGLRRRSDNPKSESVDRRSFQRTTSALRIECKSPVNGKPISLNLKDASVSGFCAVLDEPLDRISLVLGGIFALVESTLRAELVATSGESLHFHFISGTEKDRLHWLKQIAKSKHQDISISLSNSEELLHLFCESGALGTQFLKNNRHRSEAWANSLRNEHIDNFWIHRWIERTELDQLKGHVSAMRLGDNLWCIGDIVGSPDQDRKISTTFINKFLLSFGDYSLTCSPVPKQLIFWKENHPYWKTFERKLVEEGDENIFLNCLMGYVRINVGTVAHLPLAIAERIEASRTNDIIKILKKADSNGVGALVRALDFDPDRFGSPILRAAFGQTNKHFAREYFLITVTSNQYLAVLSRFPEGLSPNRSPDSAFLFPLLENEVNSEDFERVILTIQALASANGVNIPAVRTIATMSNRHLLGQTSATLRCFLGHPSMWGLHE